MVSMFASIEIDRGFKPWLGQTKDYKIDICCFSAKGFSRKNTRSGRNAIDFFFYLGGGRKTYFFS
jgi:hypothetical protein